MTGCNFLNPSLEQDLTHFLSNLVMTAFFIMRISKEEDLKKTLSKVGLLWLAAFLYEELFYFLLYTTLPETCPTLSGRPCVLAENNFMEQRTGDVGTW